MNKESVTLSSKHFYITTTLPYVNSDPHIGFAAEIVRADIIARSKKLQGFEVFFNTGTDEHGLKIYKKAVSEGIDPQAYVDSYAEKFRGLKGILGLDPSLNFIRTTDAHHKAAAQEFWERCQESGDIYKKIYKIKYCVGCELEKTESELVNGRCPLHPNMELEIIDEENYFFKFSKYQKPLLALYDTRSDFVIPSYRFNEIKAFVERGLEDFSISRLKSKMPWGVSVPNDPDHVMYVWFDALVNYISAIGWPDNHSKFKSWWPVTQYAGKDNLRQQSAMWQAMLMSAGIAPSRQIVINGFITSGGQKMSKSLGNVVNPYEVVTQYGTEPLRYFIAKELNQFEDSDFTMEKFKEAYNAHLANGLGNLVSRLMKMSQSYCGAPYITESSLMELQGKSSLEQRVFTLLNSFEINKAMDEIWKAIAEIDATIQEQKPFTVFKTDPEKARSIVKDLVSVKLASVMFALRPFMPETAEKIRQSLLTNTLEQPLFMRKE